MDSRQREHIHQLMLQHSETMVRLTYRRVGDWHLAEDLVQETFLTACCKADQICEHIKPVAWLYETLNNLTMRERRRAYHTDVSTEEIAELQCEMPLPLEFYLPKGLNDDEREVILLRLDKGYSFQELAELYGLTEAACRQRVSRAIRKCRKLIEDETQDGILK